jgi:DNA-binding transcriptional LysR family regulator
LDLLVSVETTGSLGRAAAVHGISQPAASLRLQRLERRLGLQLLVRSPTGSRLTPAGQSVVGWAHGVLDAARSLSDAADALRDKARDRLQVAASLTIADERFPQWLAALHAADPDAAVSLRVGNSTAVIDMVRARAVALGFVEGPRVPRDLRSRVVGRDELVVVVTPQHRWARRRRPLDVPELAAARFVVRETGSGTRETFEEAVAGRGLQLQPALELGSTAALKAAVVAGEGPAVVSALSVTGEIASGQLVTVPVSGMDLRRRFRAVWSAGTSLGPTAAALLAVAVRLVRPEDG